MFDEREGAVTPERAREWVMTDTQMEVIKWLANGRTGISSKTMAFWLAFVIKPEDCGHPHDPADLDRCLRLLAAAPGLRADLPSMRGISPHWSALIDRWAELEASHINEVGLGWTKGREATKTYALMRSILDPIPEPGTIRISDRITMRFPESRGGSKT